MQQKSQMIFSKATNSRRLRNHGDGFEPSPNTWKNFLYCVFDRPKIRDFMISTVRSSVHFTSTEILHFMKLLHMYQVYVNKCLKCFRIEIVKESNI